MQYVTKYSAAFWGTSFVREMTKIPNPEEVGSVEKLKEYAQKSDQAELQVQTEDAGGIELKKGQGAVKEPLTPTEPALLDKAEA
jgi:trehalose 6-phosphate synthase